MIKQDNMHIFENKSILFIATSFFGYEKKMKEKMQQLGAKVIAFDERAITTSYEKAVLKVFPSIFNKKMHRYYESIIQQTKDMSFDFVFIYGATMIDRNIVNLLKEANKESLFVLYLADSVLGVKRYEDMFPLFDRVNTFDRRDYEIYTKKFDNIHFLPLFYGDEYKTEPKSESEDYKYDLAFIGTVHSDRYSFLKKVKEEAEKEGLKVFYYLYLPSWFMFYFYKLTQRSFRKAKYKDFEYKKISAERIHEITNTTRAVVDAQYPKNTGLTMRTIEVLGMRKKLITTNEDIVNYDFYEMGNVIVVDRNQPAIRKDFLRKPFVDYPDNIYASYSLENWIIKNLIGCKYE